MVQTVPMFNRAFELSSDKVANRGVAGAIFWNGRVVIVIIKDRDQVACL